MKTYPRSIRFGRHAFTLVEMLVAIAVLVLIMVMISQLFNSAMLTTGMRSKQMDADAQARAVFDRMAIDFAQMVKRTDVDYYMKSSASDQYSDGAVPQTATGASAPYYSPGSAGSSGSNDQIAFYSQVPGYFASPYNLSTSSTYQSPVSLVAYRVNSDNTSAYFNKLQRLGYGLLWNGVTTAQLTPVQSGTSAPPQMPMIFSSGTYGATAAVQAGATGSNAIVTYWPIVTSSVSVNSDYETIGPQVFRMEYYYVIKGETVGGTTYSSMLSDIPWDVRLGHNSVNGLQDVAAIGVVLAILDPKSQMIVKSQQLSSMGAQLEDFPSTNITTGSNSMVPGQLEANWQATIQSIINGNNNTSQVPPIAASAVRVYGHTFYLPSN